MSSRRLNIRNMEEENKLRAVFEFLLRLLLALPFLVAAVFGLLAAAMFSVDLFQTD